MFKVNVDPSLVLGALTDAQDRQLPYAVSLALNRVANDAQEAERERLKSVFHLRHEQFNLRGIKINKADRATKTSWSVVIMVDGPQDYLDKFEEGGEQLPFKGRWRWLPNRDVFQGHIITAGNPLNPHNLHFERRGGELIGEQRTYMLQGKDGPLVFQRFTDIGKKRNLSRLTLDNFKGGMGPAQKREKYTLNRTEGTRLLYHLVDKYHVSATLAFIPTISNAVDGNWQQRMSEALSEAMDKSK